jgi:uncharacterized protein involved in exopolysaccharide biosynthesis
MIGAINAFLSLMFFFVIGAAAVRYMLNHPPRYEGEDDSE